MSYKEFRCPCGEWVQSYDFYKGEFGLWHNHRHGDEMGDVYGFSIRIVVGLTDKFDLAISEYRRLFGEDSVG